MQTSDTAPNSNNTGNNVNLLELVTGLCNEHDQLTMLHHVFFQASEETAGTHSEINDGLSLFSRWLHQRNISFAEKLNLLHERLRLKKRIGIF